MKRSAFKTCGGLIPNVGCDLFQSEETSEGRRDVSAGTVIIVLHFGRVSELNRRFVWFSRFDAVCSRRRTCYAF